MRYRLLSLLLVFATFIANRTLTGEETALDTRLAQLEAEVQSLRESAATSQRSCDGHVGQDFFNCECRSGGFIGGAELVAIKPFYSNSGGPNVDAAASDPFAGFINYNPVAYSYEAAPRFWFGYVGENGLGGRFRYFDAQNNAASDVSVVFSAPPGFFTQFGQFAVRTHDLELTQQVEFRHWNLQAFGGVRYAQAFQRSVVDVAGISAFDSSLSYYGVGPTFGVQGERALTSLGRWSLFFSARESLLYGTQHDRTSDFSFLYTEGNRMIDNVAATITEVSLGPQWKYRMENGGDFFVRSCVEAQYWQSVGNFAPVGTSPVPGLNHNDLDGSFGLLGFSFSVGITR